MRWIKKGIIYSPGVKTGWCVSHAVAPTVLPLDDERFKIYFTTRDDKNRSHIAWVSVLEDEGNWRVLSAGETPVLVPGAPGTFDDSGVMTSCLIQGSGEIFFYYTGWNLGVTVPFRLGIGLAISEDDGITFKKVSPGPILDRNIVDTILVASPYVLFDSGHYRMWYVSGVKWEKTSLGLKHYYHIRYASSHDGTHWKPTGHVCIDFANEMEYAIARPSILHDNGMYKMWYSYRASQKGDTYRIGYAESEDGLNWIRKDDEAGIDVSREGWDSEMICYPHVFKHQDKIFMVYNGNGYGKTGFGYAVLEG